MYKFIVNIKEQKKKFFKKKKDFCLVPPEINLSNINLNPYVVLGKNIILSCHGFGVPEINYQWLKDEKNLLETHSYGRLTNN